jgi:hypothetical protein
MLTVAMKYMGNPFREEAGYLLTLFTKDTAHPSAAELITKHYEKGKTQFQEFMRRLESQNEFTSMNPSRRTRLTSSDTVQVQVIRSEMH